MTEAADAADVAAIGVAVEASEVAAAAVTEEVAAAAVEAGERPVVAVVVAVVVQEAASELVPKSSWSPILASQEFSSREEKMMYF